MNKNIQIKKNTIVLFIVNVVTFLTLILFKTCFTKLGYQNFLVNLFFIINIILLLAGLFFNYSFLKYPNKYDELKSIKLIVIIFAIYLIVNVFGCYGINKIFNNGYSNISNKLSKYCDTYGCDKYSTKKEGNFEDFIIQKIYFDFNNVQNDIEIHTKYNSSSIISIKAIIYSQNESFSEDLIKEQIKNYFINFNYNVSSEKIREAFDKRFESSVSDGDVTYRVKEIYNEDVLDKLQTIITLNLKQE